MHDGVEYNLAAMNVERVKRPPGEERAMESVQEGAVCMPNIGPKGIKRRMTNGIISLVVGAAVLAGLVLTDQPRVARLPLALVWFFATVCIFQARAKT